MPYAIAHGPHNMAADEALLRAAESGVASLRFYGWSSATLSLGYFQPAASRHVDPGLAELPWVRRSTGGATLVHDRELTYALAMPPGSPWQTGSPWMPRMHGIIMAALNRLGLADKTAWVREPAHFGEVLCFQQQTVGDITSGGGKIVGSAQRRHRRCLLQHGAVLLGRSPWTPALPGLLETTGIALEPRQLGEVVVDAFREETGWTIEPGDWSSSEIEAIAALARDKYADPGWNERR